MLTKFKFCAYLGIIDSTFQYYNFYDGAIPAWYQISSEVNVKMMISAFLQSPRPSVNAVFIFRVIYTGIFLLFFHKNNYN